MIVAIRSACCKKHVIDKTHICSKCQKETEPLFLCEVCMGKGFLEVLDRSRITSVTLSPPTKIVECEACDGNGYLDTSWEEINELYEYEY